MANEINSVISLSCTTSLGATASSGSQSDTISQTAGADLIQATQGIAYHAATATVLDPGSCSGNVHFYAKNLDTALTINIYTGATWGSEELLSSIGPGQSISLKSVPLAKLYAVATSAGTAQLQYIMLEV